MKTRKDIRGNDPLVLAFCKRGKVPLPAKPAYYESGLFSPPLRRSPAPLTSA